MFKNFIAFFLFFTIIVITYSCKQKKTIEYSKEDYKELKNKLTEANRIIVQKENDRIISFIRRNNWEMKQTNSGLWYMFIKKSNEKNTIKRGDKVEIQYKLFLIDGTLCYSSDSIGNKTFIVGNGDVEKGLDEGIQLMSEGDSARFIIPSFLGYGLLGDNNCIPPRATLIYEIKLLKVLK